MTPQTVFPSVARRHPRVPRAAGFMVLLALVGAAGCAVGRTPLRPAPGSDIARPEGTVDRLVRGALSRCDTTRPGPTAAGGTARDADPCWRPAADTAGRVRPDTVARGPKVP